MICQLDVKEQLVLTYVLNRK
uniref:Uncharacterized protein n=1 Tax=Arundo donax TaxID=35708 RepID=A0A0A9H9W8_ARUDO